MPDGPVLSLKVVLFLSLFLYLLLCKWAVLVTSCFNFFSPTVSTLHCPLLFLKTHLTTVGIHFFPFGVCLVPKEAAPLSQLSHLFEAKRVDVHPERFGRAHRHSQARAARVGRPAEHALHGLQHVQEQRAPLGPKLDSPRNALVQVQHFEPTIIPNALLLCPLKQTTFA